MKKLFIVILLALSFSVFADDESVISCKERYGVKKCDVYLPQTLASSGQAFQYPKPVNKVLVLLNELNKSDVITLHLYGYGGEVLTANAIETALKRTKANVIISVDGPVYSAHAFLAVVKGPKIKVRISDNAFFMFHSSSIKNLDCSKYKGKTDRGIALDKKCEKMKEFHEKQDTQHLLGDPAYVLTAAELRKVLDGHDVYITGKVMKERLKEQGRLID